MRFLVRLNVLEESPNLKAEDEGVDEGEVL
jgi:hypothetical protein